MLEPEDFIFRYAGLLRGPAAEAPVLDVAAGDGRHAVFFARAGFRVVAMERDPERLALIRRRAREEGLTIEAVEADVEAMNLLPDRLGAIVNTLFLYRPLFADYARALRPGGILYYRTFTTDHADRLGHRRPGRRFLLAPGELARSFPGLETLHSDESTAGGRAMATLVARRPK